MTSEEKNEENWTSSFNPYHCRAARALMGWSISVLSGKSGISAKTIGMFERLGTASPKTLAAVRKTFEDFGISFSGTHLPEITRDARHVEAGNG